MDAVPTLSDFGTHEPGDTCLDLYLVAIIAFYGLGFGVCALVFTIRILVLYRKIRHSKWEIEKRGGDSSREPLVNTKVEEQDKM